MRAQQSLLLTRCDYTGQGGPCWGPVRSELHTKRGVTRKCTVCRGHSPMVVGMDYLLERARQ